MALSNEVEKKGFVFGLRPKPSLCATHVTCLAIRLLAGFALEALGFALGFELRVVK